MKVNGSAAPEAAFKVEILEGKKARIKFYENAESSTDESGTVTWSWDEYTITRPYYQNLSADIEANYDAWLSQAKAIDEQQTVVDQHQMRADVDYLLLLAE